MDPWFPVVEHCNEVLQASAHYIAHPSLPALNLTCVGTHIHTRLFSAEQDAAFLFEGRAYRLNQQMGLPWVRWGQFKSTC